MIHRHLAYPEDAAVTALGDAAIDDLLDRGDLRDWQPLAKIIAADPFGAMADTVLRLCNANPRYGTSPLWRAWIAQRRDRRTPAPAPVLPLGDLRRRVGLSQSVLAARIGMSQSDLSKAERRSDWRVSTLAAIVEGLGLRLRLEVVDASGRTVGTISQSNVNPS